MSENEVARIVVRGGGPPIVRTVGAVMIRIIQAPTRLIDYVLSHELVHLRLPTHGAAFWRELGRAMPDYEDRRTRLRELGPSLVW
jgi:predicted metal-dependent hydrolase